MPKGIYDRSKSKPRPKPRRAQSKNPPYFFKTKLERTEIARENSKKCPTKADQKYTEVPIAKDKKQNEWDYYTDIYDPRAIYSAEQKIQAAGAYLVTGTCKASAKICGISHQTISSWKNKSEWWPSVISKLKKDKQDELDAIMTGLIETLSVAMADRIDNGDEYFDSRTGSLYRRKMSGKDVVTSLAILYDKRAMLRGDPTSITQKISSGDQMKLLKDEFTKIAKDIAHEELSKTVIKES